LRFAFEDSLAQAVVQVGDLAGFTISADFGDSGLAVAAGFVAVKAADAVGGDVVYGVEGKTGRAVAGGFCCVEVGGLSGHFKINSSQYPKILHKRHF
jgi:hypothetical protein